MKNINAIIFDLGGVLLNISYQNTINSFKKLGITNTDDFYSKKTQSHIFNLIETGKITAKGYRPGKFFNALAHTCPCT